MGRGDYRYPKWTAAIALRTVSVWELSSPMEHNHPFGLSLRVATIRPYMSIIEEVHEDSII